MPDLQTKSTTNLQLSASSLRRELRHCFKQAHIALLDTDYAVLSNEEASALAEAYYAEQSKVGTRSWRQHDCDDVALSLMQSARKRHRTSEHQHNEAQAPAVGMLLTLRDGKFGRGHAFPLLRNADGWSVLDDTDATLRTPTTAECDSASLVLL